jgi:hypothetical protein
VLMLMLMLMLFHRLMTTDEFRKLYTSRRSISLFDIGRGAWRRPGRRARLVADVPVLYCWAPPHPFRIDSLVQLTRIYTSTHIHILTRTDRPYTHSGSGHEQSQARTEVLRLLIYLNHVRGKARTCVQ